MSEQLSALMDDECTAAELELALRRLAKDAELAACWQRYYLIGDALKKNLPQAIDPNFCDRVSRLIAAEPAWRQSSLAHHRWRKPLAGLALAASMALVMGLSFIALRQGPDEQPTGQPQQLAEKTPMRASASSRLNEYLVNHNEYASLNSIHGILPYVHMVSYDDNR